MTEPTKEQIQWFWGQCGLHYELPYWVDSNGQVAFYGETYSELLKSIYSLDNLFKYAVPKLNQVNIRGDIIESPFEVPFEVFVIYGFEKSGRAFHKDPAPALFWASYRALGDKE